MYKKDDRSWATCLVVWNGLHKVSKFYNVK